MKLVFAKSRSAHLEFLEEKIFYYPENGNIGHINCGLGPQGLGQIGYQRYDNGELYNRGAVDHVGAGTPAMTRAVSRSSSDSPERSSVVSRDFSFVDGAICRPFLQLSAS